VIIGQTHGSDTISSVPSVMLLSRQGTQQADSKTGGTGAGTDEDGARVTFHALTIGP
jgi:hypothetical protein